MVAHSGPKTRALSNAPAHSSCVRFSKIRLSPAARHPAGCPLDSLVPRRARAHLSVSGDVNSRDLFGFRKSGSKNFLRFHNFRWDMGLGARFFGPVSAPPWQSVRLPPFRPNSTVSPNSRPETPHIAPSIRPTHLNLDKHWSCVVGVRIRGKDRVLATSLRPRTSVLRDRFRPAHHSFRRRSVRFRGRRPRDDRSAARVLIQVDVDRAANRIRRSSRRTRDACPRASRRPLPRV